METMLTVGGDRVWAEDTGGDGATVVLLHPGIGDSRVWDPIMPRLTARYRVIRYDARGYGRSPAATEPFTLIDDLISVLDRLGVARATFVGCSQGGASSVDLAVLHPERVSALVLVTPGVSGYQWPDEAELDAEFEAVGDDIEGTARVALRIWAAAGHDEVAVSLLCSAAKAWLANGEFEQEGPGSFDRLGEIRVPTVLMIGHLDRPALVTCNEEMVARIPGCRRVDVPGGDHLLPLRVPDLVAAAVEELAG